MRARVGACAGLLLLGCAGQIGPSAPDGPEPDSTREPASDGAGAHEPPRRAPAFACDEGAQGAPDELRRLTMTQYANTLRDLTRWALGDAQEAERVLSSLALDELPRDARAPTPEQPHGSYRRLDQALDQTHVDATFRAASALGAALATPERLGAVVGACAVDADAENDEACLADFIRRFGARALRRPLDEGDASFYRVVYGSDPAPSAHAYGDLITVLLSAPELMYFVEHGADAHDALDAAGALEAAPAQSGRHALSAHELAARLSYHFWQTLPDDALWAAAEDGSLLEPAVLALHVERLLGDPRARAAMAELFADWLALEEVPALDAHAHDPAFAAFAGGDLPSPALREQAIDEALAMLDHIAFVEPAGLPALFTSERSFARGAELAALYGVPAWDGASSPPELPAGERPGLLTRLFFLASGTASTRPIRRGVFVRRVLLCDALGAPPANAAALLPASHAGMTTREAIEALTEQPGSACASCHASAINPLGFAFEGFDALGRPRQAQRTFDADGAPLESLPIDTTTVPRVTPGDARASSGPEDLVALMLESGKLEACFARHVFRFAFGRREDLAQDGCALERLRARLVETGRIRDLLAEVALLPELRSRRFEP